MLLVSRIKACVSRRTRQLLSHSLQAYRDQLCASLDTANATLAADIASGGAAAQKAFLAMFAGGPGGGPHVCPQGELLALPFFYHAAGPGSTLSSLMQ